MLDSNAVFIAFHEKTLRSQDVAVRVFLTDDLRALQVSWLGPRNVRKD
jgi:hypothetical protein